MEPPPYKKLIPQSPTAQEPKASVGRIIGAVAVAVIVGLVFICGRVISRFHWTDVFDDAVFGLVPLLELFFFLWVSCRVGKRIAYGPRATKWAVPLLSALVLVALEIGLFFGVVVPKRERERQEFRARMDRATEDLLYGKPR